MRARITAILMIFGLAAFTPWSLGQGIIDTKHNLSSAGTQAAQGNYAEVCVYCHTPHGGQNATGAGASGPLWNRDYTPGAFTLYSSYTLDTTPQSPPANVSRACLSCHDGTLGLNQLLNHPGVGAGTSPATDPSPFVGAAGPTNDLAGIGTDLQNDHPVSIIYTDASSYGTGGAAGEDSFAAGFRAATTVGTRDTVQNGAITLPLYGPVGSGQVECGTCHDPHEERSGGAANPNSVYFLRVINTNSQLCLTCHLK